MFPLDRVTCRLIFKDDSERYLRFICCYSTYGRRNAAEYLKIQRFNDNPQNLHFVAQYLQEIIASVYLINRFSMDSIEFWELSSLMVLKQFQGYGIAAKLTHTVIESVENGKRMIYLSVDPENYRGIKLYTKLNFEEDEELLAQCIKLKNINNGKNMVLFLQGRINRRNW